VAHHGCFDLGDGNLDLPALGSDPGGGALGDPADDLLCRAGLGRVERVGDLRRPFVALVSASKPPTHLS
jgi:hypothetical protein